MTQQHLNPILRKLESIFRLSDDERATVLSLPLQITEIAKGQDIVRQGDHPTRSFALFKGFTCNYKIAGSGQREILSFHVPGDMPDLQSLHLPVLDFSISSLSLCQVAFIPHAALLTVCSRHPRITAALWRESLIEASIGREWLVNIGQRSASQRIAHVCCELLTRMRTMGLTDGHVCEFPMTQQDLADMTGVSVVHVNRCLQGLRAAGLIRLKGKSLQVLDWIGLQTAGDFEPSYLHLLHPPVPDGSSAVTAAT